MFKLSSFGTCVFQVTSYINSEETVSSLMIIVCEKLIYRMYFYPKFKYVPGRKSVSDVVI